MVSLVESTFRKANLTSTSWKRVLAHKTSFTRARMDNVGFSDAQCIECDFNGVDFLNTDLTRSILDGSNFRKAKISDEQLFKARSLVGIIWPNGTRILI